jgi:hypothetical protein
LVRTFYPKYVPDILTLVEYVLLVPDSIARPPGSRLQAIQAPAHALNQVTLALKHWQVYSLLLGSTLDSA